MEAKFSIGRAVRHLRFDYRGVIYDVDPVFSGSDEWYEQVAKSRPPKDKPWYKVLVHQGTHETYVAERHLELDDSGDPIVHPALSYVFERFENGVYIPRARVN
jgi:heat shock protein HspQ